MSNLFRQVGRGQDRANAKRKPGWWDLCHEIGKTSRKKRDGCMNSRRYFMFRAHICSETNLLHEHELLGIDERPEDVLVGDALILSMAIDMLHGQAQVVGAGPAGER